MKKNKYKCKSGIRAIETEGREPVFTKDKELIYFNPDDPTHKSGGVKAIVVKDGLYSVDQLRKINMGSSKTKIFPEGSSIVTAENNSSDKALNAYRRGDTSKLNQIIESMPTDKTKKGRYSLKQYRTGGKLDYKNTPTSTDRYWTNDMNTIETTDQFSDSQGYYNDKGEYIRRIQVEPDIPEYLNNTFNTRDNRGHLKDYNPNEFVDINTSNEALQAQSDAYDAQSFYSTKAAKERKSMANVNSNSTNNTLKNAGWSRGGTPIGPIKDNTTANTSLTNLGNVVSRIGSIYGTTAPIWQNLALGKQRPELQQRNYLNNVKLDDSYNIQPQLNNINDAYNNQVGIINNNASTPQNRRALQQSIYNQKRQAQNELLGTKANYLTNLRNQQTTINQGINEKNLNLKNQYNTYDEMARAKVKDATTKAASQVGAFSGDLANYLNKFKQDDINKEYTQKYYDLLEKGLSKYKKKGAKDLKYKSKK